MKSKEEILQSYYTQNGADGMPEISAQDLLKAMEAYKDQCVADAFANARKLIDGITSKASYAFATLDDYIESTQLPIIKTETDELAEAVALVADSILPNFLPDDSATTELSFDFNMQGTGYTAFYKKDAKGYWQLSRWIAL
ncbi:hypothetical protein SAMN05216464_10317 [Mucilaginibacter pineti]|uniref:Uncharacterized protein n=1 Tax=Mucilaginibacter pineti TaxID=1391627 RepID=A0A1G6YM60_9SPHI|nr:hypothetical protein [Mucilaginibacter pineti]SDD91063.1 hypothetical protein SAMN05216464_10317 [Mucilaginibacter pineti]